MYRLFLAEDDESIAKAVSDLASSWDYEVHVCKNLRDVTGEFVAAAPHIVLLDLMLPFANGYYWCGEIRKISKVPIIVISSASDNMNIVMAMNMGADDFVAKPFDGSVLVAKLQAILRRSYDFAQSSPVLSHRGAFLSTGDGVLTVGDSKIELTKNEFRILLCLLENKGKTVSRERLMEKLWETDSYVDENTLTVNVNRLRKKLDSAGLEDFIATRHGVGYEIEE